MDLHPLTSPSLFLPSFPLHHPLPFFLSHPMVLFPPCPSLPLLPSPPLPPPFCGSLPLVSHSSLTIPPPFPFSPPLPPLTPSNLHMSTDWHENARLWSPERILPQLAKHAGLSPLTGWCGLHHMCRDLPCPKWKHNSGIIA